MSSTVKNMFGEAGQSVKDAAKNVGEKIAEGADNAMEFVKEKTGMGGPEEGSNMGIAGIREHMSVFGSCGHKVGVVDHVEGNALKLTKADSPDGQHHFIPLTWIARVDSHVHLNKNSMETEKNWKSDCTSCGCG